MDTFDFSHLEKDFMTRVKSASKRIVLTLPTGLGKLPLALDLLKQLRSIYYQRFLVVDRHRAPWRAYMEDKAYDLDLDLVGYGDLEALDLNSYDCLFFNGCEFLKGKDLDGLYDLLDSYPGLVVSMTSSVSRFNNIRYEMGLSDYYEMPRFDADPKDQPFKVQAYLFSTERIIHLDHIGYAGPREQRLIAGQLDDLVDLLDYQDQDREMADFCLGILQQFGLSSQAVQESFLEIQDLRKSLKEDLDSLDPLQSEKAHALFQDRVVKLQMDLISRTSLAKNKDFYRDQIIDLWSERAWGKLNESSKNFLISSLISFDDLKKRDGGKQLDYSGVCMLTSKAVDTMASLIFYRGYRDFLRDKYGQDYEKWPSPMVNRFANGPLSDQDFTLGRVRYILGLEERRGRVRIVSKQAYGEFLAYARSHLLSAYQDAQIQNILEDSLVFIEKTRLEFRNKTAHRDQMTLVDASRCNEFIITVNQGLKKMILPMNI